MTSARKGEMFFYDASLCFQKWQSCATCHPADARPDALNWDLLNDGMGNPKNTKSLLLAHRTPPSMALGVRESAQVGVRAGIRFIQFAVRPEADAVAIDQYLMSLKPMPSPKLVRNPVTKKLKLNKAAKKGKKIFEKAGCVTCHSGSLLTDMSSYNVGTGKERQEGDDRKPENTFDTPTLIEVWRTAPYLHDGRAAKIKDVLTEFNKDDMHGITSDLTEKQIDELAEYILSL
jgi:cytochrome c peroxidase